mgnify:CR=1 FL=1
MKSSKLYNKNAREAHLMAEAYNSVYEAYNIKLLAEKAVDGTLMCSKDCCGSPVMECKCGDDCPHCNCFMIQKAVKDFGLKSPLLEAYGDAEIAHLVQKATSAIKALEELSETDASAEAALYNLRDMLR